MVHWPFVFGSVEKSSKKTSVRAGESELARASSSELVARTGGAPTSDTYAKVRAIQ
jgi:hypothetical protein